MGLFSEKSEKEKQIIFAKREVKADKLNENHKFGDLLIHISRTGTIPYLEIGYNECSYKGAVHFNDGLFFCQGCRKATEKEVLRFYKKEIKGNGIKYDQKKESFSVLHNWNWQEDKYLSRITITHNDIHETLQGYKGFDRMYDSNFIGKLKREDFKINSYIFLLLKDIMDKDLFHLCK